MNKFIKQPMVTFTSNSVGSSKQSLKVLAELKCVDLGVSYSNSELVARFGLQVARCKHKKRRGPEPTFNA